MKPLTRSRFTRDFAMNRSIILNCFGESFEGRPERGKTVSPSLPRALKRVTQYETARGESPYIRPTATADNPSSTRCTLRSRCTGLRGVWFVRGILDFNKGDFICGSQRLMFHAMIRL